VRLLRAFLFAGLAAATMAGCAKPISTSELPSTGLMAYSGQAPRARLKPAAIEQPFAMPSTMPATGALAGRTLEVASTAEIVLRPREVVLTFDDGPRPGKTEAILHTLDDFGVKATFLMLGAAAQAHPQLARRVAHSGHTIGSHTFDHADLQTLGRQAALDEIARGEAAIVEALDGAGQGLSPFFRFPYLSQTGFLRTSLLGGNVVVLDVDIDSKDYYKDSAETVAQRTLDRLEARGSGIILFHDIHQRTVDMLPEFLAEIEARGYSVVRLVPKQPGVFGRDIITAQAPDLSSGL
jgi:peptidoglycan-N-acetylglucosamine deacetylase